MSENPSYDQEGADQLENSQTDAKSWKGLLGLLVFVSAGFFFIFPDFVSSVTGFVQAKRTKGWSETTGKVISSNVRARVETSEDSGPTAYYTPWSKYTYMVDGESYKGDRITYNTLEYYTAKPAHSVVDHISANREISVFYNPGDPQQSVLIRGVAVGDTAYWTLRIYLVFLIPLAASIGVIVGAKRGWVGFNLLYRYGRVLFFAIFVLNCFVLMVYEPGIDQDAIPMEWMADDVSSD
jgi:hypothetical protein